MKDNFKKLEEFLLNLNSDEVLCWDERKSYVDMSWMFIRPLDKKLIQKALANIMQNKNPNYTVKSQKNGQNPEDIPGFHIIRAQKRIIFRALGADGWTKLNITDKLNDGDNINNRITTITFDDLIKEVQKVVSNNKEVTEQEENFLIMGIKSAFSESFENFIDYYQYLLNEKRESSKHKCTIQPRQDVKGEYERKGNISPERKNHIIDFIQRDEFLNSQNICETVEVEEILKDGTIIPNSYTVYVYKDLLQETESAQKGYLFICEPLIGNRRTRLMYISEEEFNKMPVEKSEDRFGKFIEKYLDMSDYEFREEEGTCALSHTDFESYKERIEFFLQGKKGTSLTNLKYYKQRLEGLYKTKINLPYYLPKTKNDIALIGEGECLSEVDRSAQMNGKNKNEVRKRW